MTMSAVTAMDLSDLLASLVESEQLEAVVRIGTWPPEIRDVGMGQQVLSYELYERRPQPASEAGQEPGERSFFGHLPRVLADLAPVLPRETLYLFGLPSGSADSLREQLFYVPRGRGCLCIALKAHGRERQLEEYRDALLRWSPEYRVTEYVGAHEARCAVVHPGRLPHVTFLIEKFSHEYEQSGLSINLDNLVATLRASGLASYDVIHYDEWFHTGRPILPEDLRGRREAREHVIVVTCHYHSPANPPVELLAQAKQAGSKIVLIWLDKKTSVSTPEYYRVADLNVVLDGTDFELPNAWPIFTPKNPAWFHDPELPRKRDVTMLGESRHLGQRRYFGQRLRRESRIRAEVIGSSAVDHGLCLTHAEYAQVLQTSKISIALTQDAVRQLKGRIFEIVHCGALLLCDANPYVGSYFVPYEEYVPFTDYEDCIVKCAYFLANDAKRARIARSGQRKAARFYSHVVFWRGLFERVGIHGESRR